MKTILFYLAMVLVTSAERELACPTSSDRFYDPQTELCCKFGVTSNVNKDGQTLDCCNNTTYITETQVCCGKMYPKIGSDGKETKCCGVYPYVPTDNKKICCNGILHETERAGKRDNHQKCCGKEILSSSHVCCKKNKKARSFVKKSNMKCCYTDYYDRKTHYCNKGKVLPKHTKQCGFVRYDTRKQKCCNSKLFNISENDDHYKCCGSKLYNDIDQKCCEGDILIPHTAQCCKNNYYYNETQRCCNGSPTDFSKNTEQCCGLGLYDTQYQGCCGEKPYNTSTHGCCYPSEQSGCCGKAIFDWDSHICCISSRSYKLHERQSSMKCCGTDYFNITTHYCTLKKKVLQLRQSLCGNQTYDVNRDETTEATVTQFVDTASKESGRTEVSTIEPVKTNLELYIILIIASILLIAGFILLCTCICKRKWKNRQTLNTFPIQYNSSIIMEALDDTSVDDFELTNVKVVKPMFKTN